MTTPKALIIGGSVGGLFAAHMLGRIGWEVNVFERAGEDLAGRGAGIATHPALREVMRRLGLAFDDSLCWAPRAHVCWDNADRLIHEVRPQRRMSAWAPKRYRGEPQAFFLADAHSRLWHRADELTGRWSSPLLGAKRTSARSGEGAGVCLSAGIKLRCEG